MKHTVPSAVTNLHHDGNLIEAGAWFILASILALHALQGDQRLRSTLLGVSLLGFVWPVRSCRGTNRRVVASLVASPLERRLRSRDARWFHPILSLVESVKLPINTAPPQPRKGSLLEDRLQAGLVSERCGMVRSR